MSSEGISLLPPGGSARHPADCDLYCEIEGMQVEIRPGDLTQAGLFVQTTTPPQPDTEVELFLRSAAGEVTVDGLVVQVISCAKAAEDGRAPGFGLLFIHLSQAHRLWIEQTLATIREQHPRVRPRPKSAPQMPSVPPDQRPLSPKQRRLERERQETLSDLKERLSEIQQRPPWTVLGVDASASERDSKAAFFALSKRYHPHLYARYDSSEINQTVTDIFIATKRAYSSMRQASQQVSPPSKRPTTRSVSTTPASTSLRASKRSSSPAAEKPSVSRRPRHAQTTNPNARAELDTTAGIKLLAAGRFKEAKEKLKGALVLLPESSAAKLWLLICEARQLKAQERIDEAVEKYRAVLELDPNHREALEETGRRGARRRSRLLGKFWNSGGDDQ